MKQILTLCLLLVTFAAVAQEAVDNQAVVTFCSASGGCTEHISNVSIGFINNSSGCSGYQDFTSLWTNIPWNTTALLTVTNGVTLYPADQCGVWVDWNSDGDFSDPNETISVTGTPGTGPTRQPYTSRTGCQTV